MNYYLVTFKLNRMARPIEMRILAQDESDAREQAEVELETKLTEDDYENARGCSYDDELWTIEQLSENEMLCAIGAQRLPGF